MFTGIIKQTGSIQQLIPSGTGIELTIQVSHQFAREVEKQSHISIDGKVLTVVDKQDYPDHSLLKFYLSSAKVTNFHLSRMINVERAIQSGEEIPGIFFYGLVSAYVQLVEQQKLADGKVLMTVLFENYLIKYLSVNDQVCIDGVLLLIKNIRNDHLSFELYPHTLQLTNLHERVVGDLLRLEVDPITVKVARIFEKLDFKKMIKPQTKANFDGKKP